MKRVLVLSFLLVFVVTIGCSDDASILQPNAPEATLTTAPVQSGVVVRGTVTVGYTNVDADTGLRSVLGIALDEFCAGSEDFSLVDYSWITSPAGNALVHEYGEVYAEVWPAGPFDCSYFLNNEPLATGMVSYVRTDNDYFLDGGRANAYGWRAQGFLYGSDGTAYRFSEVIALLWADGAPGPELKTLKVQLIPIGRR